MFGRGAKPFRGLGVVDRSGVAEVVESAEVELPGSVAVQCGSAIPAQGHGEVLRDAEAVVIESSEIVFGRRIALTRRA